jgi:hypothetical protein
MLRAKFNFFIVSALVASLTLGFLGRLTLEQEQFPGVKRFWTMISAGNSFFPTMRQLEKWAKDSSNPDQTLVILGGSSFMLGVGQPKEKSVGAYLQEYLGDEYAVLNLAVNAGEPIGQGLYLAGHLKSQGYKVIYVSNIGGAYTPPIDNNDPYKYSYWQARAMGVFKEAINIKVKDDKVNQFLAEVNQKLYFMELLNYISYNYVGLNFTKYSGDFTLKALKEYPDMVSETPYSLRHLDPKVEETYLGIVQGWADKGYTEESFKEVVNFYESAIGLVGSPKTVLAFCQHNVRYTDQLDEKSRGRYFSTVNRLVTEFAVSEIGMISACDDLIDQDWYDVVHLVPTGAKKFAYQLSIAVKESQ